MFRMLRVILLAVTFSVILWLLSAQRGEAQSLPIRREGEIEPLNVSLNNRVTSVSVQLPADSLRSNAIAPPLSSG